MVRWHVSRCPSVGRRHAPECRKAHRPGGYSARHMAMVSGCRVGTGTVIVGMRASCGAGGEWSAARHLRERGQSRVHGHGHLCDLRRATDSVRHGYRGEKEPIQAAGLFAWRRATGAVPGAANRRESLAGERADQHPAGRGCDADHSSLAVGFAAAAPRTVLSEPNVSSRAVGDTSHLPLHEVAAQGIRSHTLAVMLSGDGGWAAIDKELSDSLAAHGIAVVGLDSRSYFSTQRDPAGASTDLA